MRTKETATTPYVAGKKEYVLPLKAWPELEVLVYNKHKNEWRDESFNVVISLTGKKLKTDETIKIRFTPHHD